MTKEIDKIESDEKADWFLQFLVKMTHNTFIEHPITLHVGGMLISGYLVNGRYFFEDLAERVSKAFEDHEVAQMMKESYMQFAEIYKKPTQEKTGTPDKEDEQKPPIYIHLRDAHIFYGSTRIPSNKGIFWRGRLDAVDGFSHGILEVGK